MTPDPTKAVPWREAIPNKDVVIGEVDNGRWVCGSKIRYYGSPEFKFMFLDSDNRLHADWVMQDPTPENIQRCLDQPRIDAERAAEALRKRREEFVGWCAQLKSALQSALTESALTTESWRERWQRECAKVFREVRDNFTDDMVEGGT